MNKLFPYLTLTLLLFTQLLYAQVTDSIKHNRSNFTKIIKGLVTDKETKAALSGVTVKLLNSDSQIGSTTNAEGIFTLHGVPVGRRSIEITYTGYTPVILSELLVTTGKELVINIELEPGSNQLAEVAVNATAGKRPLNEMAMASGRSFSPEETNRYAGAFFDPARMAQSFAGVAAGGDNNEIIVRGNSPKSLQWRLEGIEIINPNHFGGEGAAGGSISMLNSTVLGTSDFYTGALAAEYNNATSGAFDLKFRRGNTGKKEYAFTIGALGAGITLEGPFTKDRKASYLVSYRYSSLDLLKKAGVDISDGEGVPRYQDLSFNFVFPTRRAGTFSLFGIGGLGGINEIAQRDKIQWEERNDGQDLRLKYNAGSLGLKHLLIANSKLYFSNIIAYSTSRNSINIDTLDRNSYQKALVQRNIYINNAIRYAGAVNYRLNDNSAIRAGLNAGFLSYNLYGREYKRVSSSLQEIINDKGNASTFDGYIQNKYDFGALTLNTGVHANYFNLSASWSIEPRVGLNWKVTSDQQISLAAGTYSRLEPLSYYFAKGADGKESPKLQPTKSSQAVLGYEKLFAGNLKFKSEVYYQYLYNVPVSSDPFVNFSLLNVSDNLAIASSSYRSLVGKGKGTNYGLEVSLEKSLSRGYYFILTSSLFDSKFKPLNGREYSTTYNTRFVGNAVAGKEWAAGRNKKNLFGLNAKFIYTGGRKYSPVLVNESFRQDQTVIDESRINSLTSDPYIRVDFSASYRINTKKVTHYILLDIQNLLNRKNNTGMWYNPSKQLIEKNEWIGMVPTINYRIEF